LKIRNHSTSANAENKPYLGFEGDFRRGGNANS
jgi:hypothetical protein